MCKRVICFSRVSSQHQDLQPQREAIERQIIADNYSKDEIAYIQGKESAIKLKEEERQTLNEMKMLIEKHPTIESVYFFAVDRLARRMSVVMSVKEWADEHKINLVFLQPNYMSTLRRNEKGELVKNELTDLLLAMLSYGAAMEMEIKKARFAEAKKLLRQQNKVTGALPFGYTADAEGNIIIDREKAKIVTWVFDCYLYKEMSTNQIYNEGVELGYWREVKGRSGGASKICQMLKNKVYCGHTPKENKYETNYPIIIEEEKIDRAIEKMHERKQKPKVFQKNIYYAKSILKDEESNTCLITDVAHVKYKATNTEKFYGVSINIADSLIWLSAYRAKWENISTYNNEKAIENTTHTLEEISNKLTVIEKEIQQTNKKSERNYNAYIDGRISNNIYQVKDDEIKSERTKLEKKKEELINRENELLNLLDEMRKKEKLNIDIMTVRDIKDDRQRLEIIKETILKMTVRKIGDLKYIFKVYNKYNDNADKYLYISNRTKSEVYFILEKENDIVGIEGDIKDGVESGKLLNINDEIERRFIRKCR